MVGVCWVDQIKSIAWVFCMRDFFLEEACFLEGGGPIYGFFMSRVRGGGWEFRHLGVGRNESDTLRTPTAGEGIK